MDTSWRSVLRAVLTVRETTRIAVLFSCLSILLGMIVDHSDRGLPWLLFFCTQGLLATVHVVAAAWLWWALPESLTRRRARLTCVLVGAVMGAVTMLSVAHITSWRRVSFSTTISIVAIVALSVLVAVAIIGIMWLGVYQGIGRLWRLATLHDRPPPQRRLDRVLDRDRGSAAFGQLQLVSGPRARHWAGCAGGVRHSSSLLLTARPCKLPCDSRVQTAR
jgi:hypothetical protein